MLVLLSFALVLVATVLLVLGLLSDDGLTLIYISIASSVAAAVVLLIALRLNKPRVATARAAGPAPLPIPEPEPVPAGVGASVAAEPSSAAAPAASGTDEWLAADQDTWGADEGWDEVEEVEFPIADYDTLTVGQILPLLPQLYADEIDVVEERERSTKARPQVLAKLAELRDATEGAGTTDALASYTESPGADWEDEDWFPIEDYDSLSAAQIRPLLPELDAEELTLVRTRELALGRRRSLLDEIDRLLGVPTPAPAPKAATTKAPATKRSAPTTKAPAAKATAKAAPAKKTAAATKSAATRSAATKTTGAKAAATKTAATKSAATKAAATKAAAKKAPSAKKTASTAAKTTTPAKKTAAKATAASKGAVAKKASPAKKPAPAKKATKR